MRIKLRVTDGHFILKIVHLEIIREQFLGIFVGDLLFVDLEVKERFWLKVSLLGPRSASLGIDSSLSLIVDSLLQFVEIFVHLVNFVI